MSAIDRAFIRAYETDDAPIAAPPATGRAPAGPLAAAYLRVPAGRAAAEQPTPNAPPALAERRPLSAFAPAPTVEARFHPGLEVDGFRWPAIAEELCRQHTARWNHLLKSLLAAGESGRSLIGVGGAVRGAGCTTVLTCLAQMLVEAGKTAAIVDGDFAAPGLARSLGMAAEIGWEEVLAGRAPLADAMINSLSDRIAVLPLVQGGAQAAEKLDAIHASVTAGVLRYHYDFVLFDLGALHDDVQGPTARRVARRCRLDGVLLVADPRTTGALGQKQLSHAAPELADVCLGVVENQLAAA
jgi:Mrp family chromosome partitioning ATPase